MPFTPLELQLAVHQFEERIEVGDDAVALALEILINTEIVEDRLGCYRQLSLFLLRRLLHFILDFWV